MSAACARFARVALAHVACPVRAARISGAAALLAVAEEGQGDE